MPQQPQPPGRRARRDLTPGHGSVSLVEIVVYGTLASVVAGGALLLGGRDWREGLAATVGGLLLVGLVTVVLGTYGQSYRGSRRRR